MKEYTILYACGADLRYRYRHVLAPSEADALATLLDTMADPGGKDPYDLRVVEGHLHDPYDLPVSGHPVERHELDGLPLDDLFSARRACDVLSRALQNPQALLPAIGRDTACFLWDASRWAHGPDHPRPGETVGAFLQRVQRAEATHPPEPPLQPILSDGLGTPRPRPSALLTSFEGSLRRLYMATVAANPALYAQEQTDLQQLHLRSVREVASAETHCWLKPVLRAGAAALFAFLLEQPADHCLRCTTAPSPQASAPHQHYNPEEPAA